MVEYMHNLGGNIMDFVIFIISLVACIIVYKLFDNYGFKEGLIFKFITQVAYYLFEGSLIEICSMGLIPILVFLIIVFVMVLIITAIEYFVFNRTNHFWSYFILGEITEFLILFCISFVLVFVMNLLM